MEADADFYLTLGVRRDADAATIRAAYRHLMRRYHPDVNSSEDAAAKATSINEAYACLGDEERRAAYDHARKPKSSSRPFTAASRPARPMRAQHAHFSQRIFAAELEPDPPPTRWKVASLTLALLVTLVTFTLTSATPPAPPPPPVTVSFVGQAPLPPAEAPASPAPGSSE